MNLLLFFLFNVALVFVGAQVAEAGYWAHAFGLWFLGVVYALHLWPDEKR